MLKYQIGTAQIADQARGVLYCQDTYFDLQAVLNFGVPRLQGSASPRESVVIPTTLM